MKMRLLLLTFALPLWAAEDVNAVLARLIAAEDTNVKRAQQYTYTEETQHLKIDANGNRQQTASETREVLFVEGVKYRKLVARNGKPLSRGERSKVEKEMQQTAVDRRKDERRAAPGGAVFIRTTFSQLSADLGSLEELLTLFENRLAGEEEIRGHKVWIVESVPSKDHVPTTNHEKQVFVFRKKFWVDQTENTLVRAVYTVAVDGSFMSQGSTITFDHEKVDPDTWQPVSLTLEFSRQKKEPFQAVGSTVYLMTKFQKFDVQSSITATLPEK